MIFFQHTSKFRLLEDSHWGAHLGHSQVDRIMFKSNLVARALPVKKSLLYKFMILNYFSLLTSSWWGVLVSKAREIWGDHSVEPTKGWTNSKFLLSLLLRHKRNPHSWGWRRQHYLLSPRSCHCWLSDTISQTQIWTLVSQMYLPPVLLGLATSSQFNKAFGILDNSHNYSRMLTVFAIDFYSKCQLFPVFRTCVVLHSHAHYQCYF